MPEIKAADHNADVELPEEPVKEETAEEPAEEETLETPAEETETSEKQ